MVLIQVDLLIGRSKLMQLVSKGIAGHGRCHRGHSDGMQESTHESGTGTSAKMRSYEPQPSSSGTICGALGVAEPLPNHYLQTRKTPPKHKWGRRQAMQVEKFSFGPWSRCLGALNQPLALVDPTLPDHTLWLARHLPDIFGRPPFGGRS